ncbi:2-hydroxyacylsphingosine 1-beta-galactosyltransferase-like [Palaemon carinicauda]
MVGIPLMSDQHLNVRQVVNLGIGRELTLETMNSHSIMEAITAVIENQSYRDQVKIRSALLKDQETSSLDRAVYWTEHVLRHGGAQHLRSAAANMSIHQYMMIDVIAVLTLAAVVLLFCLKWLLKFLYCALLFALKKASTKLQKSIKGHLHIE